MGNESSWKWLVEGEEGSKRCGDYGESWNVED